MKKIVIGTANFNDKYGINNIKINFSELKYNLFNYIRKKKLNFFDTSLNYKLDKNFIDKLNFQESKIITKFSLPKQNKNKFLDNLQTELLNKKKQFKIKNYEAILLHNVNDLHSTFKNKIIANLKNLKKQKQVKKIGVSIYSPNDLKVVFANFDPDFIQAPINVFDKRLIESDWMKIIKKKKVSIQARSVFLQGLLLMSPKELKKQKINKKLIKQIQDFEKWCKKKKISRLEACLQFINNLNSVSYLTVGVNSKRNLVEILNASKKRKKIDFKDFSLGNTKLIDPRKW